MIQRSLRFALAAIFLLFVGCNGSGGSGEADGSSESDDVALNSISITPATSTLFKGGTKPFTATGAYSDDSTADLTSDVTWDSSDTSVATISEVGIMTSVGLGSTTITATFDAMTSNEVTASVLLPAAAGYSMDNIGGAHLPSIYISDDAGSSWSLIPAFPLPGGQPRGVLNEIVCVANDCVTVGLTFDNGFGNALPLAYTSNDGGSTWALTPDFSLPDGQTQGEIDSVTCENTTCTAVGQSWGVGFINEQPLAYTSADNGDTWTLSETLSLPDGQEEGLIGDIFCLETTCTTVGYSHDNLGDHALPLAYTSTDSGSTWTLSPTLDLPGSQTQAQIVGVNCHEGNCIAVGQSFDDSDENNKPLAYTSTDSGSTWSLSSDFTLPQTTGQLSDVLCQDEGCLAVGSSDSDATLTLPLAYSSTDGGTTWTLIPAFTLPDGQDQGLLNSVSCAEDVCIAQGSSSTIADANLIPLAYTSTDGGSTWTLAATFELPTGQTQGEFE